MKTPKSLGAAVLLALATQAGAVGGLADLTVFDRTDGRRLPVYWHEGRAYVVGKPGNEYQVSVRNRQREEVLAVVSVDGVNAVTGETASPAQSGYVLSPYGSLDIRGWRKNLERTAAFYFTSLPDSYAARTGRPDHVGVIGVALYKRKPVEPPPAPIGLAQPRSSSEAAGPRDDASSAAKSTEAPAAERDSAAGQGSSFPGTQGAARQSQPQEAARLGTGHGRQEVSHARHVSFERATADPAEVITILYDSHRNLVARGVIREPVPVAPRVPQPFPGFVPDPQARFAPLPSCC